MSNSNLVDIGSIVSNWYGNAVERRELLAMDDRMLRDIGVSRAEAIEAAKQPLWRRRAPVEPLKVDPDMVQRHIARAHALRARAMADAARTVLRWLFGRGSAQPKARIRKLAPVAR
jgi:uncharacterized protein YjiS (DUF1127 family)